MKYINKSNRFIKKSGGQITQDQEMKFVIGITLFMVVLLIIMQILFPPKNIGFAGHIDKLTNHKEYTKVLEYDSYKYNQVYANNDYKSGFLSRTLTKDYLYFRFEKNSIIQIHRDVHHAWKKERLLISNKEYYDYDVIKDINNITINDIYDKILNKNEKIRDDLVRFYYHDDDVSKVYLAVKKSELKRIGFLK